MRYIITAALFVCAALAAGSCAAADYSEADQAIVRVCIMDDREELPVWLKNDYRIYAVNSDKTVMEGYRMAAKVTPSKDGIMIGKTEVKAPGIKIKEARSAKIFIGGKCFRGDVDIIKNDNGRLMAINYVALEDYLYGVLYHEVSHRWPMEVLKAQAIAARTFALLQARNNKLQVYDLRSDIYSQVYGGSGSEKWSTNMAVNKTRGMVITYKGDLLPAYYHATCAGRTEDASNLWKVDMPPLDGVVCGFCERSPYYKWTKSMPLWKIEEKLNAGGYKIGRITSVSVVSRNPSGRVDKIEVRDASGTSVVLTGKDFRQMLGPNELRSTNFDASVRMSSLVMEGQGWGHGVGMCQWGAFGMANSGRKAEEIIRHYYPGSEITTIDKIRDKL